MQFLYGVVQHQEREYGIIVCQLPLWTAQGPDCSSGAEPDSGAVRMESPWSANAVWETLIYIPYQLAWAEFSLARVFLLTAGFEIVCIRIDKQQLSRWTAIQPRLQTAVCI